MPYIDAGLQVILLEQPRVQQRRVVVVVGRVMGAARKEMLPAILGGSKLRLQGMHRQQQHLSGTDMPL